MVHLVVANLKNICFYNEYKGEAPVVGKVMTVRFCISFMNSGTVRRSHHGAKGIIYIVQDHYFIIRLR